VSFADRYALASRDDTFRARISMATVQRALATTGTDSPDLITLGVFVLAGQSSDLAEMLTRVGLAVLSNPNIDPDSDTAIVTELAAIWPKLAFSFARSGRRGAGPGPVMSPGPILLDDAEAGPARPVTSGPPERADGIEQPTGPPPEPPVVEIDGDGNQTRGK
jgi:hypothetical protein